MTAAMHSTQCKKGANKYDPQVGAAAAKNAEIAEKSMQFSEDYFNKYMAPLINEMTAQSADTRKNENELYASNKKSMDQAQQRYEQYGIPAEDRYFKMVDEYSAPQEEERQAGLAIGDARVAQQGQRQQLNRSLAGLGIDPTSPAAMAAMSDQAVLGAATETGAANRARAAAKTLGMQLSSDAANFGRGGQSSTLAFGQAAQGNTAASAATGGAAVGSAGSGAGVVQNGYGLGLKGYGANLDAYSGMAQQAKAQAGAAAAGIGNMLGSLGAAWIGD